MLANGCGGGGGGCTAAVPACNACGRTVDLHNPFLFVQDLEECGCMGGGGYGGGYGGGGGCGGGGGYGGGGGGCGAAPMCGTPSCAPPSDCNSCCSYCPLSVHWSCSYYNPPYCCPIAYSTPTCCPGTCSAPACCPGTCSAPACCPGSCSAPACCGMPSACSAPAMCAGSQCPADAQGSCCGMPMGGMEQMGCGMPMGGMDQMGCSPAPGPPCPVENSNPFLFLDDLECAGGCGADNNDYNADTLACCGSLYTPLCNVYERKGSIPYGISGLCARPMYQLINGAVRSNVNCLRSNGLQDFCELRGRFPPCRPCAG